MKTLFVLGINWNVNSGVTERLVITQLLFTFTTASSVPFVTRIQKRAGRSM